MIGDCRTAPRRFTPKPLRRREETDGKPLYLPLHIVDGTEEAPDGHSPDEHPASPRPRHRDRITS